MRSPDVISEKVSGEVQEDLGRGLSPRIGSQ